jgi:hypothetical protein
MGSDEHMQQRVDIPERARTVSLRWVHVVDPTNSTRTL